MVYHVGPQAKTIQCIMLYNIYTCSYMYTRLRARERKRLTDMFTSRNMPLYESDGLRHDVSIIESKAWKGSMNNRNDS